MKKTDIAGLVEIVLGNHEQARLAVDSLLDVIA